MQPLYIVLVLLVLFTVATLALVRRHADVVTTLRKAWQTELSSLSNELQTERQTSSQLREKAGRFEGQLNELQKTAVGSREQLTEAARRLEAADARITELTREHAEAKTGRDGANERVAELTKLLDQQSDETRRLQDQISELRTQQAKAEADLESAKQLKADTTAFFNEAQIRLSHVATQSATQALGEKGVELQAQSRTELSMLLKPVSDTITAFQARAEQLYADTSSQTSHLAGALQQLTANQQRVADDYAAFARAMKGNPKARGDWGELILETVLQTSGLEEGVHYLSQESAVDDESGDRVRPDIVVKLPGDRHVIVDSKLSLLAWHDATNCGEDDRDGYEAAMQRHLAALRARVKELSEKSYPKAVGSSALEVTIAFVAIESALADALRADPNLLRYAFQRGVVFASPNTLMAVLVVVERLWTRDKLARTAKEVADTGGRVLDSVIKFVSEFEAIGKRLRDVNEAFSAAKYSLQESQQGVVSRTRRLVELGVKGKRPIPEQLQLDDGAGGGTAPDLIELEGNSSRFLPGAVAEGDMAGADTSEIPF
jgi:DNA recombination protein RmuC